MGKSEGPQSYCIECGTELPNNASFCPECGAEVDDTAGTEKENDQRQIKPPDVEKLVDRAKGSIKPELLNQTRKPKTFLSGSRSEGDIILFDEPLITYIESEEQPEYLLKHPSYGLRIIEPNGDERTPHHVPGGAHRFLLVTDTRLLYVAAYDSEDNVREFKYSEIENVESRGAFFASPAIEFHTQDGMKYRFAHEGKPLPQTTLSRAHQYIKTKIE